MTEPVTFNISQALDRAYALLANALFYADLLARHAHDAQTKLGSAEPTDAALPFPFRTQNSAIPKQVREQFADEITRYSLIYALAHCDRFVFDLGVIDAIADRVVAGGGTITLEQMRQVEEDARKVEFGRSVARELAKLGAAENPAVAVGVRWFEGLYALRNCLVHRAGITGIEDRKLLAGITWRRMSVAVGDQELTALPVVIEEGGELNMRFADADRTWQPGEPIRLSLAELHEMMYSLSALAGMLVQHMNSEFTATFGCGPDGAEAST